MIGYDKEPEKQRVTLTGLYESLKLGYENQRITAMIRSYISCGHSKSEGILPVKSNSGNVGLKFDGSIRLPLNFLLNTDFTMVKRFGYIEESMNDINCIWNAGLEYLIQKGVWRIALTAHDLLNQTKDINYIINASGRTQTLNTVLPRYLMLTLHYRFDWKPKKK